MSTALYRERRVLWMPLSAGWSPPTKDAAFCCREMAAAIDFACDQHPDPFDCPDALIVYNEVFDEYGLAIHDGGASYLLIDACPFCATRLPPSQRDRYFETLEARGLDAAGEGELPPEFLSGAWRRG